MSELVDHVQAKAHEVAREDFDKAKGLLADAAKSRAYLYPFKGIFYFFYHKALWKPAARRIGPTLALSAGVFVPMLLLTYVPQLAVMVLVNGPLAVLTTVLLILNESSAIVSIVSRNWLLEDALLDTFDGTLVARDTTAVVREGRQLKPGGDAIERLGRVLKRPFRQLNSKALVRYLMYLPLNLIPVVGTVLFIAMQARGRGNSVHSRYFQLKGWSTAQKNEWLRKHSGAYASFGLAATLLEMIPFGAIVFAFTNTVGAALWAADIESKGTAMTDSTAPGLREIAEDE